MKAIISLGLLVIFLAAAFIFDNIADGQLIEKSQVVLKNGSVESPSEKIALDEAEKEPLIKVEPGLWIFEYHKGERSVRNEILLNPDGTFSAFLKLKAGSQIPVEAKADGTYAINGRVIVFKVISGNKNLFKNTGRTLIDSATPTTLILSNKQTYLKK